MTALTQRIEEGSTKLAEQHRRLMSVVSSMDDEGDALDDSQFDGLRGALPPFNEAVQTLHAGVLAFAPEALKISDESVQQILQHAHGAIADVDAHWQSFNGVLVRLGERIEALRPMAENSLARVVEQLEAHAAQLTAANGEMLQGISTASSSLGGLVSKQVEQATKNLGEQAGKFHDRLSEHLEPHLRRVSDEATRTAEQAFTAFSKSGDEAAKSLRDALEHALQALTDEIDVAIRQKLPDMQRELVDEATEALAAEITEGIAMSTIGAKVSAAMSPYLLQLIAIKQILEALLEAIRIFNKLKSGGGLFE